MCCSVLRPYHAECTGSRLITEVKQHWAGLVLGWVGDRLAGPSAVGLFAHRQWAARYPFFPCIARSAVDSSCAPSLIAPALPPCSQC